MAQHRPLRPAAIALLACSIQLFVPASADPRVLERPVPYDKIPDETSAAIPDQEAVVFWSARGRQILTLTTAGGDNPAFCPDPAASGRGPAVCRADFLVLRDGRIEAIGRNRFRRAGRRDPAIREVLGALGVGRSDTAFVRIPPRRLLMPGIVDPHTHIFNDSERILDRDGIPVGRNAADHEAALLAAQDIAIRNGITSAGNLFVTRDGLSSLRNLAGRNDLKVRLSLYLPYTDPGGNPGEVDVTDLLPPGSSRPWVLGKRLRVEGVKIFVDGGSVGRRANSYEQQLGVGDLWFPDPDGDGSNPDLNNIVREFHCRGFQVAMHASGDLAIPVAQSAIRQAENTAGCPGGRDNVLRHRIEHHQVVTREIVNADLASNVAVTIPFQTWACSPHIPSEEFTTRYYNWDRLVDTGVRNGLHVAWHGDDPYFSNWQGTVAPFRELHTAVTRLEIPRSPWQGLESGVCLLPERFRRTGLMVAEALPMMTIEGAYMLHRDKQIGSLDPGKLADLIVVSKDPLALARGHRRHARVPVMRRIRHSLRAELRDPVHEIRNTHVLMTMIGGRVEFCAEGHEHLCVHAD